MKTGCVLALIVGGLIGLFVLMIGMTVMSTFNQEATLATAIEAKQQANTAEFDNMWKKIKQVVEIPDREMDKLKDIFVSNSDARTSDNQGQMMAWITEAVPSVDTSSFKNLMNIITSSRDSFTMRQIELVDLNRERNKLLATFPSGFILKIFGRKPIDITIVTSTRTEKAFETGKDDEDLDLYKKD